MRLRNILILLAILLALGGYFYYANVSQTPPAPSPQLFAWLIDTEDIQHITIRLPKEDLSQAFAKAPDRSWRFDDPQQSEIDMKRWGGGIPLLLSGPGTEKIIAKNAPPEKLTEFGLAQPRMEIILTLQDSSVLNIRVGENTPDGSKFYLQIPESNDVALVDYTWYDVIERLVKEPPYVTSASEGKS